MEINQNSYLVIMFTSTLVIRATVSGSAKKRRAVLPSLVVPLPCFTTSTSRSISVSRSRSSNETVATNPLNENQRFPLRKTCLRVVWKRYFIWVVQTSRRGRLTSNIPFEGLRQQSWHGLTQIAVIYSSKSYSQSCSVFLPFGGSRTSFLGILLSSSTT